MTIICFYIQNPVVAAEVSSLVTGINGAMTLAVFSSNVPGTFAVPRTIPATAALITEPGVIPISRQSEQQTSHQPAKCPRAIIPLGDAIKAIENKTNPILSRFSKITTPISNIQSRISDLQSGLFEKLRIQCLIPKILRPFHPIFKYIRCLLGMEDEDDDRGFMETPPCNASACMNPHIEDRVITHDRGMPNLDFMIEGRVSTMDDCFPDMEKVVYGSRVIAKIVDDVPCENSTYSEMCQEAIDDNRMVMEEDCESQG